MTKDMLLKIFPFAKARIDTFLLPLSEAMTEYGINTPLRQAAFLAQVGHESGQLRYVKELASGDAYEGRAGLGNTQPGDGVKYKGRGLIQVTGRSNYAAVASALNIDCVVHPELLEQPVEACRVSAWWWKTHGLNELADSGTDESFKKITKTINGGYLGLAERVALYKTARKVLAC